MWSDLQLMLDQEFIQIQSVDFIHGRRNEPSSGVPVPRRSLSGITLCEHLDLKQLEQGEDATMPFMLSFKKNRFLPNALSAMWSTNQRVVCIKADQENASTPSFKKFLEDNQDLRL